MGSSNKIKYPYQDYSLKDRKSEEWDDIPFLDGAYQISNYGRIKSLRRWLERSSRGGFWISEKILKARISTQIVNKGKRKLHRLGISVSFDGKKHSLAIARIVYYLFVKKFDLEDRRLVVSYRDDNPFNIMPKNLILTTASKNMSKAYRENRRPRESFGNKARPVSQYDTTGKWMCTYLSLSQAASITGIDSSNICESLNHRSTYTCGYLWRYGSNKKRIKISTSVKKRLTFERLHSQIISQYDMQGNKVKEYSSLKAAAKAVKVPTNSIRAVILGIRLSAKKYYWALGPGKDKISLQHINENRRKWEEKICRPITQYDLQGNKIKAYKSIAEASRVLILHSMNIFDALRNEGNYIAKGFLWTYGNGPAKIKVNSTIKRKYYLDKLFQQHVTQYNMQGVRVAQYSSLKEAAKAVNGQVNGLGATLEGKYLTFKRYFWRLGKRSAKIDVTKANKTLQSRVRKMSKPLIQYNLHGRKVREYDSLSAASRATNTSASQIRGVASGKYKMAKGFSWKFKG